MGCYRIEPFAGAANSHELTLSITHIFVTLFTRSHATRPFSHAEKNKKTVQLITWAAPCITTCVRRLVRVCVCMLMFRIKQLTKLKFVLKAAG